MDQYKEIRSIASQIHKIQKFPIYADSEICAVLFWDLGDIDNDAVCLFCFVGCARMTASCALIDKEDQGFDVMI